MAYIGNFPTDLGFSGINFKQETITKVTNTQSGRAIRASIGSTKFAGTLAFPSATVSEFRQVQGFIAQCKGPLNEFDIVLPNISESQSPNAGVYTLTLTSNYSAGVDALNFTTTPLTGNVNVLKAGDLIRFSNHSKVYMCTTDINTDSAGTGVLNIAPNLVEAVTTAQTITTNNTPIRMFLTNDLQEMGYTVDGFVTFELDVAEVL